MTRRPPTRSKLMRPSRSQRRSVSTLTPSAWAAAPIRNVPGGRGPSSILIPRNCVGYRRAATLHGLPSSSPSPHWRCPPLGERAERLRGGVAARRASRRSTGAPTYNFAGSNALQLQIERGAPADVFASASPRRPQALFESGNCDRPVTFATNKLVMIVPKDNPGNDHVGLQPAQRRPAPGDRHRRRADRRLHARAAAAARPDSRILTRNTVSQEPNVASIVSKVALGSADAGFAYVTDGKIAARSRERDRAAALRPAAGPLPDLPGHARRRRRCAARRAFIAQGPLAAAGASVLRRAGLRAAARRPAAKQPTTDAATRRAGRLGRPARAVRRARADVPRAADRRAVRRGAARATCPSLLGDPVVQDAHRGHRAHEPRRQRPDHRARHADGLRAGDAALPRALARRDARRAAARPAARRRGHRPARRLRRRRACSGPTCATPGSSCRSPSGRSCSR